MNKIGTGFLGLSLILLAGCSSGSSDSSWTRLLGSSAEETANGVAIGKDGSILLAGSTQGTIDGSPNRGGLDGFLAKYNTDGDLQWKKPLATSENDEARAVTVDNDGRIFVTGYTGGDLDGKGGPKDDQIFVAQFNADGEQVWLQLYGETTAVNTNATKESGEGIALTSDGGLAVVGYTMNSFGKAVGENIERDAFVLKLGLDGAVIDSKRLESNRNDVANGVAISPDGAFYVVGTTDGTLGGDQGQANVKEGVSDAFVARIGASPEESWVRLVGTAASEVGNAIAVDPTTADVYIGGNASTGLTGIEAKGMGDGFVAKFDRTGAAQWQRLFGGEGIDTLEGLAVGKNGQVFATGVNWEKGNSNLYVAAYTGQGEQKNVYTASGDDNQAWGRAIVSDGQGRLVVTGRAFGNLSNEKGSGGADAFLFKLKESAVVPE